MKPVQKAAFTLNLPQLKKLALEGADLTGSLLAAASSHDPNPKTQEAVIKFLITAGVSVNETDPAGVTPLHRAVRFRSPSAVRALLTLGANANAIDRRGRSSPLHRAVTLTGAPTSANKGNEAFLIIKMLLLNGADPTIKNAKGKIPRDYTRNVDVVTCLEQAQVV